MTRTGTNYVVSEDGLTLTIMAVRGNRVLDAVIKRPKGLPWDQTGIDRALQMVEEMPDRMIAPGDNRRARRIKIHPRWNLFLHLDTGPPTWWLPKVIFESHAVTFGWYRACVSIALKKVS